MLVTDFDFALPEDLIAQTAAPRGQSRLLALDRGTGSFEHRAIADLPAFLRPGDVLVVNDTRVFAARLLGHRVPSGGAVECLLLSPRPAAGSQLPARECIDPRVRVAVANGVDRSGRVGCPDASRPEAQTRSRGQVRRRRRRADGGSARATFPGTPHDPSVVGIGSERHGTRGRDRSRAAAALHQARRHGSRWRALSDGVCARAWFGGRADRGAALHRVAAGGAGRSRCRARLDHAARRLRHIQAGQGRPRRGSRRRSRDLRDH